MRLLRLDLANGRSSIDFHPFVSVAADLSAADLDELLETVRRLARGSTAGVRGLIQNQGILVDLDGYGDDDRSAAITGANVIVECDAATEAGIAEIQSRIEQTASRLEIDAVVVEELRADLDPAAQARVALLEDQLGPDDEARLLNLDAAIERISAALAATTAHPPTVHVATPEILDLRRRWAAHSVRRSNAEEHFAALMTGIEFAEQRAAAARHAAEQARREAKPVLLTRTEEARLEALSFPDQDETRKGKWRKVLRPEEEQEKTELLDRVGVASWTAYTVYRAAPTSPPERIEAAAAAERALAEAEARLEDARMKLAQDELTAELNDAEDEIRADARSYLGQLLPADVGAALDDLVVEKPNPRWLDAVRALNREMPSIAPPSVQSATSPVEAELGAPEAEQVVIAAERWLDAKRRERASIDFDRLRSELSDARRQLDRHRRVLPRLQRAEIALAASRKRLGELRALVEASGGRSGVDAVLAVVAPVVAQIQLEAGGSVPIAVLGRFDAFDDTEVGELMDGLRRLAESVQVIVVSDSPSLHRWAEEIGLERAMVSRPKSVDRSTAV